MTVCFATNNAKKLEEIRQLLEPEYEVSSLADIGCREELPETGHTLEANSKQKAQYVWENYGIACFADDTGLEVEALGGEPGVYSARYAGPERDNEANIDLLLHELQGQENRRARFRTLITWVDDEKVKQFEGIVEGEILPERLGGKGFGYDPVFRPEGAEKTFAQMSMEEKNSMSHRGRALRKLVGFLKEASDQDKNS
jgi:XTP/dITP diphosphohydrolase